MKFRKRYLLYLPVFLLLGVVVAYYVGPKYEFEPIVLSEERLEMPLEDLDQFLEEKEAKIKLLKPNNASHIVWADSIRKTPYSFVYLHGFSASPMEGHPVHRELAQRYQSNLYLPRLSGHGRQTIESFKDLQPNDLINDAKQALEIGHLIGDSVILVSCSTGGTLSAFLAATYPELVHAQIMYSPNFEIHDPTAQLLTGPWGYQMAKLASGGVYRSFELPPEGKKYWTTEYRIEGLIALQSLLDYTMTEENFKKIDQPYFIGYYYESDTLFDDIVSIPAMKEFHNLTSTSPNKKTLLPFAEAGNHVLISNIQAKDYSQVQKETYHFLENIVGLQASTPLSIQSQIEE